jgi:hypothetical protein
VNKIAHQKRSKFRMQILSVIVNESRFKSMSIKLLNMLVVLLAISACSEIKPWVKPYERSNLADPIMSLDRHGAAGSYMHHVYQARESARGAEGGSGGGCGCN